MKQKVIALLLVLAMSMTLLAGCGGGASDGGGESEASGSAGESGGSDASGGIAGMQMGGSIGSGDVEGTGAQELTIGLINDIGSFYPGGAGTSGVKTKRVMCYETLFWKDPEGEMHPLLAKSCENVGGSTYAIELFDYITDSEGNPMTADDIVFSIDLYIEDGQNSSTWATISDYHSTGDYTFEITFDPEVTGQLKDFLTRVPMVTQAAWENSPDEMASYPVGTGGYVLNTAESTAGSIYVFDRRDDYWQTDEQYICDRNRNLLTKLTARVITDASTLALALQNGQIEFTTDLASNDWGLFINDDGAPVPGYTVMEGQNNAFVHMTFNCGENSPCQDIKLRQAICYAIDATACAYSVYGNLGRTCNAATNPNLSDSSVDYGHDGYFEQDLDLAKQLVEESSYNGETLKMLVLPNTAVSGSVTLIQAYCREIGVDIEPLEYDMATFRKVRVEPTGAEYDIELLGATSADDTVYVSVKELDNRAYGNGLGRHFVADDELQQLYEDAGNAATTSPEVIQALLDHIEENCYIYGLFYCPKMLVGMDKIVGGVAIPFDDAIYPAFVIQN